MLERMLPVDGIDIILLDNFTIEQMRRAVEMRNLAGLKNKVELEASGGVTLASVRNIAETGVERISVRRTDTFLAVYRYGDRDRPGVSTYAGR